MWISWLFTNLILNFLWLCQKQCFIPDLPFFSCFQRCNKLKNTIWCFQLVASLQQVENTKHQNWFTETGWKLTLILWNSTQLPALLLAAFPRLSSIPSNISMSGNLCPPTDMVQVCGCLCAVSALSTDDISLVWCLWFHTSFLCGFTVFFASPLFFGSRRFSSPPHLQLYRSTDIKQPDEFHLAETNWPLKNKKRQLFLTWTHMLAASLPLSGPQGAWSCPVGHLHPLPLPAWSFHIQTSSSGPIG